MTIDTKNGRNNMTEIDIATLKQADTTTLAKWWCELNRFGWPEAFADPEPASPALHGRRSEMMDWIRAKISIKECLREWNRDTTPGQKFDEWFDGSGRSFSVNNQRNPQ